MALSVGLFSVFGAQAPDLQMAFQDNESSVFVRSELSDPHQLFWTEISEQVRDYRAEKNYTVALEVVASAINLEPKAAGLMHVWSGDIYLQANDYQNALFEYELAEAEFGREIINNKLVGETALKQAARAAIHFKDPANASQYAWELATRYPESDRAEIALAWSLYYQAMAESDFDIMALETAQYAGVCDSANPCYIKDKQLYRQG